MDQFGPYYVLPAEKNCQHELVSYFQGFGD